MDRRDSQPGASHHPVPLPVPHEVWRGGFGERQGGDAAGLVPVGHAAVVLASRRFLSVAGEVGVREVVVVPGFGAAESLN